MLSIGEFASLGRVTVRLLRHYDEIGLLKPARVDPSSGYRSYAPDQVPVLTRILQLRDFGLRLDDVARIVGSQTDPAVEQELLRSAREQLMGRIEDNTLRLQRLDAYLRMTHGEPMPVTIDADVLPVPPERVAYLTGIAGGWGSRHIGPVVGPLFGELGRMLAASGVDDAGPAIAIYEAEETGDQTTVRVTAAMVVDDSVRPSDRLQLTTLPGIDTAAIAVHRGAVAGIDQSWHALMDWITISGLELTGISREVYLSPPDVPQQDWITQLQQPVGRAVPAA